MGGRRRTRGIVLKAAECEGKGEVRGRRGLAGGGGRGEGGGVGG